MVLEVTFFKTHELVCSHVYRKHGDGAMKFADPRLIKWLEWFREAIGLPVIINTYGTGGKYTQRGYRCNMCQLVREKTVNNVMYLSAHTRFQAVDFQVPDMLDEEVRQWIERHKNEMPCNIRIERDTTGWVHVDVATDNYQKITYFEA